MEYIPEDVFGIILEYIKFSDYKNIIFINKKYKDLFLSIDYKNNDFRNKVIINKKKFIEIVKFNLVILNKILSFDCNLIYSAISNNIKIKNYKYENLISLIMIIKLGRSLINSISYLSERIYGYTIYYWMSNKYQEMINHLEIVKANINNKPFIKLRKSKYII